MNLKLIFADGIKQAIKCLRPVIAAMMVASTAIHQSAPHLLICYEFSLVSRNSDFIPLTDSFVESAILIQAVTFLSFSLQSNHPLKIVLRKTLFFRSTKNQ